MAWVGLSFVYSGLEDPEQARRAVGQAETLATAASAREKRRIALRAKQLEAMADPGDTARHAAYKKALDDALAIDFEDVELWLLRGNAEEASAAGRGQRGGASSTAFYHAALRLAPDNADAHHFLTHSYETIGQIPLALKHGEAYARLSPAIPHAHHMWGHDLRRVGRIDDAIAAFRRTNEMEKAYYAAERIPAEMDWHHVHNLDLLATAYQHKGQMRQAEATMREAEALPPTTDYVEFNQKLLSIFLLGRQRWDEATESTSRLIRGRWSATRAVGHALAGHALLARSRIPEARAALLAAERELAAVPASGAGIAVSRGQVEPWVDTLRGELLLREGAVAEGRRSLEEVARTLRALPGPDAWIQALFRLESMARVAREAGRVGAGRVHGPADARARRGLRRDRTWPWPWWPNTPAIARPPRRHGRRRRASGGTPTPTCPSCRSSAGRRRAPNPEHEQPPAGGAPARVQDRVRPAARRGVRAGGRERLRPPSARPASTRSPAACTPPATARSSGPCGSTRASAPLRSRTAVTAICSSAAPPACPSRSTCPRRSDTTPTTLIPRARSAGWAWPSTASRTWRCCSTASPSSACPRR